MKAAFPRSLAALALIGAILLAGCQKREETMTSDTTSSQSSAPSDQTHGTAGGDTSGAPGSQATPSPTASKPALPPALPSGHIEVQHVLIGFSGSVPGKPITRTQEQARTLAYDILSRAKGGADFGQLVQQNTDDQYPGIYRLADRGVEVEQGVEYSRDGMVKGFSDVAFSLKQGDVGIADFSKTTSPYGWHIIKRLR